MFKEKDSDCIQATSFMDSNYVGDLDKRRSTTGYILTLCGGAISWKSKLQPIVSLSTTKVEYIVVTDAIKEALWLKGLQMELEVIQELLTIYSDSQSAIHLSKNLVFKRVPNMLM